MSAPENPPAFPYSWQWEMPDGEKLWKNHDGMSLRDWFAGQVLSAVYSGLPNGADFTEVAELAFGVADAMLAEREAASLAQRSSGE